MGLIKSMPYMILFPGLSLFFFWQLEGEEGIAVDLAIIELFFFIFLSKLGAGKRPDKKTEQAMRLYLPLGSISSGEPMTMEIELPDT